MSSNGTFHNDEELEPNQSPELSDGDVIKIGNCSFKFKLYFNVRFFFSSCFQNQCW